MQSTRYGNKLSKCLTASVNELKSWTDTVNEIHGSSQITTTSQVPNAGLSVLSETINYTGRDSLSRPINFRFRTLLTRARPYLDRYETFRQSVVNNEEEILDELTMVSVQICSLSADNFYLFIISVIVCWFPISTVSPAMIWQGLAAVLKLKSENKSDV